MGKKSKKRQRSESIQSEQTEADDARKRLAAFHARMFELPNETTTASAGAEMPRVQWKPSGKKYKSKKTQMEEESEAVPMVKFNNTKKEKKGMKKEQKKQKVVVESQQQQKKNKKTGPAAIKVPGMPTVAVETGLFKKTEQIGAHQVNNQQRHKQKNKKMKFQKQVTAPTPAVTNKMQAMEAPQWHSMNTNEEQEDDDGVDPLEQALVSVQKEIINKQVTPPPRKKRKVKSSKSTAVPETENTRKTGKNMTKDDDTVDAKGANSPKADAGYNADAEKGNDRLSKQEMKRKQLQNTTLPARTEAKQKAHNFKQSNTADFLLKTCPELVSVDFLEGLGINLSAKQLVRVFEEGSGNSGVLMNKMASAVENGHLSVRDPSFVSALENSVALMETNIEVLELLHPLLESLSTVRDVGCLLKQLCEHWQLERTVALVQQILLSSVFDDLDGNQDEILIDLPHLKGRLDFPSRLDQDDVDENGNLAGFLANDDSDFSGEEGSEEEPDEIDSEDDDDHYDGESDSEEEIEITGRSRARSQFIEDEADVGEEDDEEEEEEEAEEEEELKEARGRGDDASSSSDSD
ncbi:hypothetical protein JM18_001288 [Phytophthora kernoviae]|uniref:Uncharacterized protein n=2 Tax=Phytophthora kernoviae TaxID=325452 RepID=A0A8T0M723_9STRA|nr:hypothetical protein G195_003128 [Phytophthora kernoviae 00238/432]KAG2529127.1 hypothetical protein JM16_002174 [Phytophthora kernoviae]KAG2532349.1 hypothetical protein JM18_001288 [Phytophthora kernoviae]